MQVCLYVRENYQLYEQLNFPACIHYRVSAYRYCTVSYIRYINQANCMYIPMGIYDTVRFIPNFLYYDMCL